VGGHLSALRRTAVGPYGLEVARDLDDLRSRFERAVPDAVLPLADAARAAFPSVGLSEEQARDVRVGRRLAIALDAITAVFAPDGEFLALYEPAGPGDHAGDHPAAKPLAVFVG
jgi:tRNA pseudouridine55 synthase